MRQIKLSCHLILKRIQVKRNISHYPAFKEVSIWIEVVTLSRQYLPQRVIFSESAISQNFHTDLFKLYHVKYILMTFRIV